VYRLTTDGTIDRRMVERATGKRRLEKLIIKQGQFVGHQRKVTKLSESGELAPEELLKLLNSKDYSREVQSNGYGKILFEIKNRRVYFVTILVFTDEELEQLLDRSDMMQMKDKAVAEQKETLKRKHPDSNTKHHFAVV
jgi:hypothetical protein